MKLGVCDYVVLLLFDVHFLYTRKAVARQNVIKCFYNNIVSKCKNSVML